MLDSRKLQLYLLPFVFLVSLFATLGSLYFSEIMKLPPCILCWYQRIFMYPIVAISGIALFRKDKKWVFYVLPLALIGLGVAIYHNLLYFGILPDSAEPCTLGISCTAMFLQIFGFLDIPQLSLIAFILITASSLLYLRLQKE